MARVTDNGLSGSVGNIIFYRSGGVNYARSKPGKRKRMKGQPVNSLNGIFGVVSTYGSGMIKRMSSSFLFPFGLRTYNLLRGWMCTMYGARFSDAVWELTVKNNTMCQLNPSSDLRDFLGAGITVTDNGAGTIEIQIPEINPKKDLKAPAGTQLVNLKMIVVTSPFRQTGYPSNFCMEQYLFNFSDTILPARKIILDTKSAPGDIAIVVIALEFETIRSGKGIYSTDKRWLPAAVIAMGRLKD